MEVPASEANQTGPPGDDPRSTVGGNTRTLFFPTMTTSDKSITLDVLFKGHEPVLARIVESLGKGISASNVATIYVKPILKDLEANAGTGLDPTYVVYMIQYTISQSK